MARYYTISSISSLQFSKSANFAKPVLRLMRTTKLIYEVLKASGIQSIQVSVDIGMSFQKKIKMNLMLGWIVIL